MPHRPVPPPFGGHKKVRTAGPDRSVPAGARGHEHTRERTRGGPRERYGDPSAVDGPGLAIRRGRVFGLLGPHGAGETTTPKVLRDSGSPDAGGITVLSTGPATATRAGRSRAGIVRQDESPPAGLTGRGVRL
ncbi:ATP-binding cassette domain-containing protein [Streptomyces echinatus]|uniref:ATP-binding cassette domain-containing protein n=1 Tax=Streptomyces echinatus TaxID=67293 RepID=UPI0037F169D8